MREILRDLVPGQDYGVQFQSVGLDAVSEWSPIYRFRTAGDVTPPAPITGLIWRATGSSFLGIWDAVTTDGDGGPLKDFKDYEVTVSAGGTSKVFYVTQPTFELTLAMNADTFGEIAFTVQIDVRTRDQTGNLSGPVSATATEDTPPKVTTPVVQPYFGGIQVSWDGNPATGIRNELNLDHVEIHASKASGFTPSSTTLIGRFEGVFPNTQTQTFTNLDYGAVYYIRLVAVNRFGRAGVPSDQASATPIRITNIDIEDGQIDVDQINFTAYDIGGANAYYPATVTAMNAISTAKANDIAYVTGSGYDTYRYDGSSWVLAPEIGVVQGSKILAGTVTSNAVGTNLLITAAANIANAVIDDAKITNLDGAKINAGTLTASAIGANTIITNAANIQDAIITSAKISSITADKISTGNLNAVLVVTGRVATSSTGARTELNSLGFQKFASDGVTKLIDFTGTQNLLTGTLQTALAPARRIVIGAAGSEGRVDFFAPNGDNGFVYSYSEASGTTEAIQLGMSSTSTSPLWNRINFNVNDGTNTEYATFQSGTVELMFDRSDPNGGAFKLFSTTAKGNPGTAVTVPRMVIDINGLQYWDDSTSQRLFIDARSGGGINLYDRAGRRRMLIDDSYFTVYDPSSLIQRFNIAGTEISFRVGTSSTQQLIAFDDEPADTSPSIGMVDTGGSGGRIYARTPSGTPTRFEFTNIVRTAYIPLMASAFNVSSLSSTKENISDIEPGSLDKVRKLKVKRYKRRVTGEEEVGLTVEGSPADIVRDKETIGLYPLVSILVAAIQELSKETESIRNELEKK